MTTKSKSLALVLYAGGSNLGDELTLKGGLNLLNRAIPGVRFRIVDFNEPFFEFRGLEINDVDLVAVVGSPWVWDQALESMKYKWIMYLRKYFPRIPVLALGVGTSLYLQNLDQRFLAYISNQTTSVNSDTVTLREVWGQFDLVGSREPFAHKILKGLQVNSKNLMDISAWARVPVRLGVPADLNPAPVLWFYLPSRQILGDYESFDYGGYIESALIWAQSEGARVLCMLKEESEFLSTRGIHHELVESLDEAFVEISGAQEVRSGRVHMAIVARLAGVRKVTLDAVDSRAWTVTRFGIPFRLPGSDSPIAVYAAFFRYRLWRIRQKFDEARYLIQIRKSIRKYGPRR